MYGRKRKERGARKYAATTKKQKKNALTFTRTPLRRERGRNWKWVSVSGLQKTEGGEGKSERERESAVD